MACTRCARKNVIVFKCGRNILRRKIIKREEGNLTDVLRKDNYRNVTPSSNTLEEAINYIKKLYGTTEGVFTVYHFRKKSLFCMFSNVEER